MNHPHPEGSVLIGLLWCLAILALVVVATLHTAEMDLLAGKHFSDKIQARYLALAGIERAEALLYQNARDRSRSAKNHTGDYYNDPADFRDITLGRGSYSLLRRGRDDEGGGVIYGVSDEESRLDLNTARSEELTNLPNLDSTLADAILGWRGQGGSVAERDYYLSLVPPRQPRNGPFQTIRELLMVRGITSDLVFGRDTHADGLLDDLAQDPHDAPEYLPTVSADDLGWAACLTVDSHDKNVSATGETRLDIQNADENDLATLPGVTRDLAHAIVTYRGQHRFQTIFDLLDVTPPNNNNTAFGGNASQHVIDEKLFRDLADRITVSSDRTQNGLINVNTASLQVLMCLPGIDRVLAQAIISRRQSAGFFDSLADLTEVDGLSPDILKPIAPLLTTRSETYRLLAEGRVKSTGARQRIQVIVQINLDGVKTLSYREDNL